MTSHSGQLSLLSSAGQEMSTIQGTVAVLFGWEGNDRSVVTLLARLQPEGPSFSAEFVCLSVCVSLTGTSTLQR